MSEYGEYCTVLGTRRYSVLASMAPTVRYSNFEYREHRAVLAGFQLIGEYGQVLTVLPAGVDETGDRIKNEGLKYRKKGASTVSTRSGARRSENFGVFFVHGT